MKIMKIEKASSFLTMSVVCMAALCGTSFAQENNRLVTEDRVLISEDADCFLFSDNDKSEVLPTPFSSAVFTQMGAPVGGYPTITDLAVFGGKLFLATSKAPLGDWGTNIFHTTNGTAFTKVLEDNTSQGYLRMGVYDNKLWIPDGDPNGLDPSFVYTSTTGALGSFTQTQVLQSVHTFDIIKYNNNFYCSNGMSTGQGGLCKFDGTNTWNSVYQSASSMRMKYMAVFNGKLFAANRLSSSDIDLFVWSGDPGTVNPALTNPLSGATNTFRMFTSTLGGKLFWSVGAAAANVLATSNGSTWQTITSLAGKVVSDFADFNGNLYALTNDGLWESTDFSTFTKIAPAPASDPTAFTPAAAGPGINPDGVASMEVFNGALWCGSSRNGKLYRVDFTTSVSDNQIASNPYTVTDHSVIFQMKSAASVELRVYNLVGSLVKTVSLGTVNKGDHEIRLDELKEGVYLLQAIIGEDVKGIKYVKR